MQAEQVPSPEFIALKCNDAQLFHAFPLSHRILIYLTAALDKDSYSGENLEKHFPILKVLMDPTFSKVPSVKMQWYLLTSLESICANCLPELTDKFMFFLLHLYNSDLLDEDVIREWNENTRSEFTLEDVPDEVLVQVRKGAKRFIDHLDAEADDEDGTTFRE